MNFLMHRTLCLLSAALGLTMTATFTQTKISALDYRTGLPVEVEIQNEKIVAVRPTENLSESRPLYIAPGLIDNQVNGFAGVSFGFGGGELTREGVCKATQKLWEKGVTTFLRRLRPPIESL